jgi:hypothetical protein
VVYGRDGERVRVDDRNLAPLTISRAALNAARARIGSYRHRLVVIEPGTVTADRLRAAVTVGVADGAEHLSQNSAPFSLPAWRKWARMMTDTRNAKAWPRVFADPRSLVGALVSMYERIEPVGTGGGTYAACTPTSSTRRRRCSTARNSGRWRPGSVRSPPRGTAWPRRRCR